MTDKLALPTLIALSSVALGKPVASSLAVLGEISIAGTLIKVDELANSLQVCLDSGAKKVLLPIVSAADIGAVPSDLIGCFKCRASVSVNSEIMKTNIFIGNVIIRNSEWGNKFVENLSKDMKMRFPSAKGYSVRNLKYMKKFAQTFTEDDVDEYGLGRITWSHHQILMSKVSNREEYIWYLEKTLEHKWSVDDLTSQVKSQLYERQAVANKISNFERRLPAEQKNMVLSTMKDPYMFDFIDYTEEMLETDIENELVKNVTSLLMELGTGFAFMGQQYHLEVGEKDFYIDLLFYNTKLRCYVAIDLKTGEFKPEQAGKMNFYLSALDDLVKAPEDNPSVGLILCRDENRTIAEYALRDMSKPIGVSEYHLCTDLPLDLKNALPAVEDIRSRIDMKK